MVTAKYRVVGNIEQIDYTLISEHRTLRMAGKSLQKRRQGNLSRVIDASGNDVTGDALDAANGF